MAGILHSGAALHRGFRRGRRAGKKRKRSGRRPSMGPVERRRAPRQPRSATRGVRRETGPSMRPTRSCPVKRLATISGRRSSARRSKPRHPSPRLPQIAKGWPAVHRRGSRAAARGRREARRHRGPLPPPRSAAPGRPRKPVASTAPAHKTATASAAAPFSAKGEAATSASAPAPTRAPSRLPPTRRCHSQRTPTEASSQNARNGKPPIHATPRAIAMSVTPAAARSGRSSPIRARRGSSGAGRFAGSAAVGSRRHGRLTRRTLRARARRLFPRNVARAPKTDRARPETPPCRNRASGSAETRTRHRRPATAENSTAAALRTSG